MARGRTWPLTACSLWILGFSTERRSSSRPAFEAGRLRLTQSVDHVYKSGLVDVRTQAPLQPLQDNLESQTYETFEKDGTKYATYKAAVAAALRDRVPDAEAATRTTVLMARIRRCGCPAVHKCSQRRS